MSSRILTADGKSRTPPWLTLPDVTLVAVTSVAIPQTIRAMTLSLRQAQFGAAIFLSDRPPPPGTSSDILWTKVEPIRSRLAYSHFMLRDLQRYVTTSHVLCVQWDGYVIDARGWDPAFLDYDYIGAPWPHFRDPYNVGNGGFSLRSRRLLDACRTLRIDDTLEDVAICRVHRGGLERDFAIRFAPEALARRFAFERYASTGLEFGFHGAFNMVKLGNAKVFGSLLAELEPALLNRREHRELLWSALRQGHFMLAVTIVCRILRQGAGKR